MVKETYIAPEILAKWSELYVSGIPSTTISKEFGFAKGTVLKHLKRLGVILRPKGVVSSKDLNSPLKTCSKCSLAKPRSAFCKRSRARDGLQDRCKPCGAALMRSRYILDPELQNKKNREQYYSDPEHHKNRVRRWQSENLDRVKSVRKTRYNKRYISDAQYKIARTLRTRLLQAIRGQNSGKSASAVKDLGCTIQELVVYLEHLWLPGMNWGNHRRLGWHIDHIRPLASFDLTDPEQQRQACHYTNLQPLWAYENLTKGDKWDGGNLNLSEQAPKD